MARDVTGVLVAFITLAGISVAILRGSQFATAFQGFANGFATMTKAATATG